MRSLWEIMLVQWLAPPGEWEEKDGPDPIGLMSAGAPEIAVAVQRETATEAGAAPAADARPLVRQTPATGDIHADHVIE